MTEIADSMSEEDVRLQKLGDLKKAGVNPFSYSYSRTHSILDIIDKYDSLESGETTDDTVSIAGRIVAKRGHGKAIFGNIKDDSGTIQFYANINDLGEELYDRLLHLDVGDIIGVQGFPFKSRRGELTVHITSYELLTKSLNSFPEKYHGLQDKELRYRQRYLDLIVNDEVKETFKRRSEVLFWIRQFLHNQNFMEVETPVLQSIYGGASAKPFTTFHNDLKQDLFLRIALELPLKRLIVGGYEKVFEVGRVFRNEGISYKHNPEYTLLELYQAYADYQDVMALTETLLSELIIAINGSPKLTYQGTELDFSPPFNRITMDEALQTYASISLHASETDLRNKASELGIANAEEASKGQLINFIYDKAVEDHLIQPTFVMDYPWETSPLAKKHRTSPELVERFELIVNSMELANAFSELNDPIDQMARFEDQVKAREAGDDEAHVMDEDFVNALRQGMPPTGGLGLGIDRIVMLLTNSASIRDVLFFPHMKTKD